MMRHAWVYCVSLVLATMLTLGLFASYGIGIQTHEWRSFRGVPTLDPVSGKFRIIQDEPLVRDYYLNAINGFGLAGVVAGFHWLVRLRSRTPQQPLITLELVWFMQGSLIAVTLCFTIVAAASRPVCPHPRMASLFIWGHLACVFLASAALIEKVFVPSAVRQRGAPIIGVGIIAVSFLDLAGYSETVGAL